MVDEVGNKQECLAGSECRIPVSCHRAKLEHGVDRHELDSGPLVELPCGHALEHALHRLSATGVAVMHGVLDKPSLTVDEAKIDAPGVHRKRVDTACLAAGGAQPVEDLMKHAKDVPVERPTRVDGRVRKAVHFRESQAPPIEPADGDTSGKTGHYHVFIDPATPPTADGQVIPKNDKIIHTDQSTATIPMYLYSDSRVAATPALNAASSHHS